MINRETCTSAGLLLLRIAFAGLMLGHGIPKLLAFNELAVKFADPLGMGSQLSLIAAIGTEVGCSILLLLGLGTRLAAIALAFTMGVALFMVHGADPWQKRELAACFMAVYITLLWTGAGAFSLDRMIRNRNRSRIDEVTAKG